MYISCAHMVEMITTRFSHRIILIVRGMLDKHWYPDKSGISKFEGGVFIIQNTAKTEHFGRKVIKRSSQTLRHLIRYCEVLFLLQFLSSY